MTIVRRPSPFGELVSFRQAMDRLLEDTFARAWEGSESSALPVDVIREPDALVVEAALPGIRPEDVDVTVEDGTLTIRAEYRDERSAGESESVVREIRRGSMARAIALPTGLEPDKATATFEYGVLTLRIPKAEAVKPRHIRISPTTDGQSSNAPADASAGSGRTPQHDESQGS